MAVNKNVNCVQVNDIGAAISQYQNQGCSVKWQSRSGCAMIECKDTDVYVCPTPRDGPGVSRSAHDEMDETYQDYWNEIPD